MKLVFATHNMNKLKEIQTMLPDHIELLSLDDIDCNEDIPESGDTIDENAILKAEYVKNNYGYDCFADDTGLEVEALAGAPGVYSARYSGEEKNDDANMDKVLSQLIDKKDRSARFKTVIALTLKGNQSLFTGVCEGSILNEKRGNKGFGYDPIFLPKGYDKTFAEMNIDEKTKISHRGIAFRQLIEYLSK
ncbi:non-canonical purine NTP diphosphatase [Christiangramia sabulilitoris]|uniref:dITP/XTP pyrophosphatase n=1 Tax=Christiangramia sabulilitoris TaxID=2583991 RepID=A0A550I6P6_9FLAO|nr:non-canonical purine NTP diphosphatase [Christiangramia sabulilitoris]TRO66639.1 non-canonical purine NTP diphosphatase [Christiangramia sabulilitoris]